MVGESGKKRKVLAGTTKDVLRLVQSIPSKKAEPFKIWLAQVGSERLDEIAATEKALQRGVEYYRKKGYPEDWITQRLLSIKIRKELTAEWQEHGITEEKDYAILTNEMTKAWSGKSIQEYKQLKDLKKENLRDNMTDMELVLNMLAEVTTTTFSKQEQPQTFAESISGHTFPISSPSSQHRKSSKSNNFLSSCPIVDTTSSSRISDIKY